MVVWDTNIVIDYVSYAGELWKLDTEPDEFVGAEPDHLIDLQLLRVVLAVWVMRTVEFVILPRSVTDAKTALSEERSNQRARLHRDFDEALRLLVDPDDDPIVFPASQSDVDAALAAVPRGADRELVRGAYATRHACLSYPRPRDPWGES